MPITYCPNCKQKYKVEPDMIGFKVECTVCNTTFVVQDCSSTSIKNPKLRIIPQDERTNNGIESHSSDYFLGQSNRQKNNTKRNVIIAVIVVLLFFLTILLLIHSSTPSIEVRAKAIQRVDDQINKILPETPNLSSMEDVDVLITMFDTFAGYDFNFNDCPSEYMILVMMEQRTIRELSSVLRRIKELDKNKNNTEALLVMETMAYGSSPSYSNFQNEAEELKRSTQEIISTLQSINDSMKTIKNKYGIIN